MSNEVAGAVYVDESVHRSRNLVVASFVSIDDVATCELAVREALEEAGLTPYRDEFKSSAFVARDARLAALRKAMSEALFVHARIGAVLASLDERNVLPSLIVDSIAAIVDNGELPGSGCVYVDEGIAERRPRPDDARELVARGWSVQWEQDSKTVIGLQLADLAAAEIALMVRYLRDGVFKWRPEADAEPDPRRREALWALGSHEIEAYRRNFFGHVDTSDIETNEAWIPLKRCLDVAIFTSPGLDAELRERVESEFASLYVGCNE